MTRLNFALIAFFMILFWVSCEEVVVKEPVKQDYFMKFYGGFHSDQITDIIVNSDEHIVMTGFRNSAEGREKAWVIKTNEQGMVVWENMVDGSDDCKGYGVFTDGVINQIGCYEKPESDVQKGFFFRYDQEGSIIDSLYFDINADVVKDMKFLSTGSGLRFYAHINRNGDDEIVFYKLKNKNIVTVTTNNLYNTISGRLFKHEKANGDVLFCGNINENGETGETDILIVHMENNSISWTNIYGKEGISEKSAGIMSQSGFIYLAKNVFTKQNAPENFIVQKLDVGGVPIDQYIANLSEKNYVCDFVNSTDKNELVFTGYKQVDNKNTSAFMARDSIKGTSVVEKTYGYKGVTKGRFIRKLPNEKGYVIAGTVSTSGLNSEAKDVMVIKVNQECEWINE